MTRSSKFSLFLLILLLWGCDSNRVFEEDTSFTEKQWHMDYMPAFEFMIEDAAAKNIILKFRSDLEYPYQNIYITYFLMDAQGNELDSKLVNIPLFDEISGKPLGDGNSVYQYAQEILSGYKFPGSGKYSIKLAQYMRSETLDGVYSVGIRVENVE